MQWKQKVGCPLWWESCLSVLDSASMEAQQWRDCDLTHQRIRMYFPKLKLQSLANCAGFLLQVHR